MEWLAIKALGVARGWWLLAGLVLAALALWLLIGAREAADDKANQEIGAAVQREGDLVETVKRVEKANEAAATIERDPAARRDRCLRHSRTPENCRHVVPDVPGD